MNAPPPTTPSLPHSGGFQVPRTPPPRTAASHSPSQPHRLPPPPHPSSPSHHHHHHNHNHNHAHTATSPYTPLSPSQLLTASPQTVRQKLAEAQATISRLTLQHNLLLLSTSEALSRAQVEADIARTQTDVVSAWRRSAERRVRRLQRENHLLKERREKQQQQQQRRRGGREGSGDTGLEALVSVLEGEVKTPRRERGAGISAGAAGGGGGGAGRKVGVTGGLRSPVTFTKDSGGGGRKRRRGSRDTTISVEEEGSPSPRKKGKEMGGLGTPVSPGPTATEGV